MEAVISRRVGLTNNSEIRDGWHAGDERHLFFSCDCNSDILHETTTAPYMYMTDCPCANSLVVHDDSVHHAKAVAMAWASAILPPSSAHSTVHRCGRPPASRPKMHSRRGS